MASASSKASPRCKEREIFFSDMKKLPKMEPDENMFEIVALLTMMFSITGVWMDWKKSAWIAFCVSVINISNYRPGHEVKQIFSSIFISIASLYMLYLKDSSPIQDSSSSSNNY